MYQMNLVSAIQTQVAEDVCHELAEHSWPVKLMPYGDIYKYVCTCSSSMGIDFKLWALLCLL